jgi:CRISPR/Cas system-associated protein Cas10 (large subunit of type III CRISPR-Cas system)
MNIQTWIETLLSDQPTGKNFEPPVLLAADADRVTDYVFETPGLPEMRGASAQLKWLNLASVQYLLREAEMPSDFVDDDPPGCLVYAAGGGLLALVPQSKAASLQAEIERLYPEYTGAATITCVVVPTSPDEIRHKETRRKFGDVVRQAGYLLRTAKGQKTALPFFELLPFTRRCEACRKRPATQFLPPHEGEPPEAYCRVCAAKRKEGWERRSEWHEKLDVQSPRDLEHIANASGGYIGVVYADGNGLGDWFQEAKTVAEYRDRSQSVGEAVDEALWDALREHCAGQKHPFEVILVGGDDVLLIVPACDALPVAHDICKRFEEKMSTEKQTMSAGVVVAEHHTPVYFLRRLAEDLLKNAKKRVKEENGKQVQISTVDFLVLKGQGTRSAEQAREKIQIGPDADTLILNHGPYTLEELDRLLKQVRRGREAGFSHSQLYALRTSLRQGRQASALAFLYQQGRARDDGVRDFLNDLAHQWSDEAEETPPWRESRRLRCGAKEYRTPWADLVDVWGFVK